jgi:tetratricopeptide (TPR) repeat protein
MTLRGAAILLVIAASMLAVASGVSAQVPPRDLWPQAAAAARDGDFDSAERHLTALMAAGKNNGIRRFPIYAEAAAALAGESARENADLARWAGLAAKRLDPRSAGVAFSEADQAARGDDWGAALRLALQGLDRVSADYRRNVLSRADLLIVLVIAIAITAIVLALALFIRYGRTMAHDFREMLGSILSGGSVTLLAFAMLLLPLFLWLGPVWLLFYWFAIFFAYGGIGERIAILLLLGGVALLPVALTAAANWIAGVDSPVVVAAISSADQTYEPEALRRLQELIAVVPDDARLHLLLGNMLSFEGMEDQAAVHYRRATELRPQYAGAHVNLGNLLFQTNEYQAAMTEYAKAQGSEPDLALAYYNHSVASGELYRFDQQARMLDQARRTDRSFIERLRRYPPPQKVVMYDPPLREAWEVAEVASRRPEARGLFGNYSSFDPVQAATNPVTLGALAALILGPAIWAFRRRKGMANACIKCGRTYCHRCKSARESATYCTQCIHIYLKRDGVSLDTKRKKLEEVSDHQAGIQRRDRIFAVLLPGAAQMLEGRSLTGVLGLFSFSIAASIAVLVGRLAPALGPSADVAQLLVRAVAIFIAVLIWLIMTIPVYRRRSMA